MDCPLYGGKKMSRAEQRKMFGKGKAGKLPKLVLPGDTRGGIMTQAGILAMNATKKETSPILRGVWLLEKVLGYELREPPMNTPPLPSGKSVKKLSFREIFEKHRADKRCAICHDKIDPLGFALEGFGTRGQLRKSKEVYGELPGGFKYKGFQDFKAVLKKHFTAEIKANIVRRFLSFATTRELTFSDQAVVKEVCGKLNEESSYDELIFFIASHSLFNEVYPK